MLPKSKPSIVHIPALDTLRGFAILGVIAFHYFRFTPGLRHIVGLGWTGVELFFVLSGFLITRILMSTKTEGHFFRNFYVRRILRIFPLYYSVLFICLVLVPLLWPLPFFLHYTFQFQNQAYFWLYAQNFLFYFKGWGQDNFLGFTWSLSIEEQFYLVWPLVVYYSKKRWLALICIGLILGNFFLRVFLFSAGVPAVELSAFDLFRFDALATGAMAALYIDNKNMKFYFKKYKWLLIIFSLGYWVVLLFTNTLYSELPFHASVGFTLTDISYGCILCLMYYAGDKKYPGHDVLHSLAKYSYGLYIFHWLIYYYVVRPVLTFFSFSSSAFLYPWIMGFAAFALSLLLSYLSYQYFEKPFLRLKRYFD